jgi:hypothetical protein
MCPYNRNALTWMLCECRYTHAELQCNTCGAHWKINPSSHWRGGPISKHINGLGTNKDLVMGPKTKNNSASEEQQQFTTMLCCVKVKMGVVAWLPVLWDRKIWSCIPTTNCPQNYSSLSGLICRTFQACNWKFPGLSSYPCILVVPKLWEFLGHFPHFILWHGHYLDRSVKW